MSQASTFKRYYEDELAFLRELGGEFSHSYPDIARELGLQGHDPDVERLLQGVAFLTGRIRQSLAAQFPDLLYPLLSHVWPQALRPTPCTAWVTPAARRTGQTNQALDATHPRIAASTRGSRSWPVHRRRSNA